MTKLTKLSTVLAGSALLILASCSTASPANNNQTSNQAKHQMMDGKHQAEMAQMKKDHQMMMKMDMSKMDMSKLSTECQTMMTKMKTKMADKHKDGAMQAGMKDHDMSKMKEKGMMRDHDPEQMKTMMAKHKKCMAEMKEALPGKH